MNREQKAEFLMQYEETKSALERKRKELASVGDLLSSLGMELQHKPQEVLFENQPYHMTIWGELPFVHDDLNVLNLDYFRKATTEIRELMEKFDTLEEERQKLQF